MSSLLSARSSCERAHHLPQLGGEVALGARLEQPRHLHGDGRGPGHDAAVAHELRHCAAERERIDAGMRAEALVLVGEQQLEKARIDIVAVAGNRQRPSGVA